MSVSDQFYNFVTFTPIGDDGPIVEARAFLLLEARFVRRVGLKAGVNTAVMPWSEWDKLKDHLKKPAKLEFWATADPRADGDPKPDCVLHELRIVDYTVSRFGDAKGRPVKSPIEYKVFIADIRERFESPRGGRVSDGRLNDATATVFQLNSALMDRCLERMGIGFDEAPSSVNAVQPPFDLKWFGNHAPTELAKLLDRVGAVFVPLANGVGHIDMIGTGDVPDFDPDLIAEDRPEGGIDRRGEMVIFTSAPLGVLETIRITQWKWVIQDATGNKWVDASTLISNADVRNKFASLPNARRDLVSVEAYRCILLDFAAQQDLNHMSPNTPTLRKLVADATDTGNLSNIRIWANMAVQGADGKWSNSETAVLVVPERLMDSPRGPILVLPKMIGNVDMPGSPDLITHFLVMPQNFLYVEATVEPLRIVPGSEGDGTPDYAPEFFNVGFKSDAGGIVQMSDDDVANAVESPGADTLIISQPSLRLVRIFGQDINKQEITAKARELAPRYLATEPTGRSVTLRGFAQEELSGRVLEIQLDQQRVETVFIIDTWYQPRGGKLDAKYLEGKEISAFEGQHDTAAQKLYEGGAAGQQPAVAIAVPSSVATSTVAGGTSTLTVRDDGTIVTSPTRGLLFWDDHGGRKDWNLNLIGSDEVQIEWQGIRVTDCNGVGADPLEFPGAITVDEIRTLQFLSGLEVTAGADIYTVNIGLKLKGDGQTATSGSYAGGIRIEDNSSCTAGKTVKWNGMTVLSAGVVLNGHTFRWTELDFDGGLQAAVETADQRAKVTVKTKNWTGVTAITCNGDGTISVTTETVKVVDA